MSVGTDALATGIKTLVANLTKAPCYDHDEAQRLSSRPSQHTIIYLSRRFGGPVLGDTTDDRLRRLQVRCVASSVTNVRLLEDRLNGGFENATHIIAGALVHFAFETADAAPEYDRDEQRYHSLADYTFAV